MYVEGSRGDLLGWKAMAIVAGCVCVCLIEAFCMLASTAAAVEMTDE